MKKLLMVVLIISLMLFGSVALANDASDQRVGDTAVVGDDIEIGDGEFKIISYDGEDAVVGDDIEIGDGEAKIISYDGEDVVVGDDIEIGDGEAKIISIDDEEEQEKDKWVWPTVGGAGALLLAGGTVFVIKSKK